MSTRKRPNAHVAPRRRDAARNDPTRKVRATFSLSSQTVARLQATVNQSAYIENLVEARAREVSHALLVLEPLGWKTRDLATVCRALADFTLPSYAAHAAHVARSVSHEDPALAERITNDTVARALAQIAEDYWHGRRSLVDEEEAATHHGSTTRRGPRKPH